LQDYVDYPTHLLIMKDGMDPPA